MDRRRSRPWICLLIASIVFSGCQPTQPFFYNEDGDLSHFVDMATQIEFPDVETAPLPDAQFTHEPLSLINSESGTPWDLSLEEVISISLNNSKVIRTIAQVRQSRQVGAGVAGPPENLLINAEFSPTVYDAAIEETGPNGVETALAAFDAQVSTNLFWERTDRPQNVNEGTGELIFARLLERDFMNFQSELTKRSATGTQWSFRNVSTYDSSNRPLRVLTSEWLTSFEAEARHPLLRGGGTQVNRIPVTLARIRTDVTLAQFSLAVRNHVAETERAYWDLYFFYRNLEAAKIGRDSAQRTWQLENARFEQGVEALPREEQSREQYYFFRGRVEEAKRDLLIAERQLRFLMGIAATDGRIIRPTDEPTIARVRFDWSDILTESLVRSDEIRRQKWLVKSREMELIAARNNLLPQVDLVALYRWLGLGDDLSSSSRRGQNFPNFGSTAWDELTEGRFQEWRLGIDVRMPIGFRAEHAAVRHQQLQLAREKARLEDLELEVSHSLTDAIQRLDANFALVQTTFLQRAAAKRQVDALASKEESSGAPDFQLQVLLDAQRRLAEAEIAFYQALVQYNLAILEVHFRKGSLLEYCGVMLQEGPWPAKAYYDALALARQRDASYYFDYGYSRPRVISQGTEPHASEEVLFPPLELPKSTVIGSGVPTPADPNSAPGEGLPTEAEPLPVPTEAIPDEQAKPRSAVRFLESAAGNRPRSTGPSAATTSAFVEVAPRGQSATTSSPEKFDWSGMFE